MNNSMIILVFLIDMYQRSYIHGLDYSNSMIDHIYFILIIYEARLDMSSSYELISNSYVLDMFFSNSYIHPSSEW